MMEDNGLPCPTSLPRMLGVTTIGERGQVVIPAEARKLLEVNTGDRFVVFGGNVDGALLLIKGDAFNSLAQPLHERVRRLQSASPGAGRPSQQRTGRRTVMFITCAGSLPGGLCCRA